FAVLAKADDPWPTAAPRDLGWSFKGYRTTKDDRPTFLYARGDLKVADFPQPLGGKELALRRTLTLTSASPPANLVYRAAVGDRIEEAPDGSFRIDGWRLKVTGARGRVRTSGGKAELLVPVTFRDGKAEVEVEYVW